MANDEKGNMCKSGNIEGTEESSKKVKSAKVNAGKKVSKSKDDKREETKTLKRRWQRTDLNDGNDDGEKRTRSKRRKMTEMAKDTNNKPNQMKNNRSKKTGMENAENNKTSKVTSAKDKSIVSKLFVHSQWLSAQSSYFKSLFYSGLKETYSKEVVMKIYERELQAHLTLIEAMYKLDVLNDKDYKLIVEVLVLAHKYDVRLLVKKCKYVLLSITPNLDICEYVLHGIKHISDTAAICEMLKEFLVKEFTPIEKTWNTDKFIDLSEPALRLLLGSDHLATQSENTIFVALMKWIRVNLSWRARRACDLLDVLRFEFMSVDFLHDVVQDHSIAKVMPGFNKYIQKGLAYHGFSKVRKEQLEPKPKKRPYVADFGPTFSWVIDNGLHKKLTASPGKFFYSDVFWYQGYKMKLKLMYMDNLTRCGFFFTICNLKGKACLYASYRAQSSLFASRTLRTAKRCFTAPEPDWGFWNLECNIDAMEKGYTIDIWVDIN